MYLSAAQLLFELCFICIKPVLTNSFSAEHFCPQKKCFEHHELNGVSLDRRRDPRRIDANGNPINAPPWRYSPERGPSEQQSNSVLETVYHPERYKVSSCRDFAQGRVCPYNVLCSHRHVREGMDEDSVYQPPWLQYSPTRANPTITDSEIKQMILQYKVHGPCTKGCEQTDKPPYYKCPFYHGTAENSFDMRRPLCVENGEWLPEQRNLLTMTELSFHPAKYKQEMCRAANERRRCPNGRFCSYCHSDEEWDNVSRCLEELKKEVQAQVCIAIVLQHARVHLLTTNSLRHTFFVFTARAWC